MTRCIVFPLILDSIRVGTWYYYKILDSIRVGTWYYYKTAGIRLGIDFLFSSFNFPFLIIALSL